MSRERLFNLEVQRYLDGEDVQVDPGARAEADRFREALAAYAASLEVPGPEVDRAVMAVVGARRTPARRRAFWRWFVQPRAVALSPALAAALVVLALGIGWWAGTRQSPSAPARIAAAEPGTVLVRFEFRAPGAQEVAVAGSFTNWDDEGVPLTYNPATGLWTVTLPLAPGEHEYLFRVDGERWVPDPSAHAQVDDGFGQVNSVIVVGPRGVVRS